MLFDIQVLLLDLSVHCCTYIVSPLKSGKVKKQPDNLYTQSASLFLDTTWTGPALVAAGSTLSSTCATWLYQSGQYCRRGTITVSRALKRAKRQL